MEKLKDKIAPFLKYLGIKDNIDYKTEIIDNNLNIITSLTLSNSQGYIKYETKNEFSSYQGELGETYSHINLIIPKEKLKIDYGLYRSDSQYYIIQATIRIRRIYYIKLVAYTRDFKKWNTNLGLIEL